MHDKRLDFVFAEKFMDGTAGNRKIAVETISNGSNSNSFHGWNTVHKLIKVFGIKKDVGCSLLLLARGLGPLLYKKNGTVGNTLD